MVHAIHLCCQLWCPWQEAALSMLQGAGVSWILLLAINIQIWFWFSWIYYEPSNILKLIIVLLIPDNTSILTNIIVWWNDLKAQTMWLYKICYSEYSFKKCLKVWLQGKMMLQADVYHNTQRGINRRNQRYSGN